MLLLSLSLLCMIAFFFFKQKTAYEMRISDWSPDVCSSDLLTETDAPSAYREEARALLHKRLEGLVRLANEFRDLRKTTDYRHTPYTALGAERLVVLPSDLTRLLDAAGARPGVA